MKLKLISEEFYLDQNDRTIDVIEAENGVHLITAYIAKAWEDGKTTRNNSIRCVAKNELHDFNIDYIVDAFKVLFKHPSFNGKVITFDNYDDSIVDALVAKRLLIKVDGGFVLGDGSGSSRLDFDNRYIDVNIDDIFNNTQELARVIEHHAANHGGVRWPELEKFFTIYAYDYSFLFKYLNNINDKWLHGDVTANHILEDSPNSAIKDLCESLSGHNLYTTLSSNNIDSLVKARVDQYLEFNDDVFDYINNNTQAQKIVAKYGLLIYRSITSGLLTIYRNKKLEVSEESIRSLLDTIMNSWVGMMVEYAKKFYKLPDLNSLVNLDINSLKRFGVKLKRWS